MALPSSCRQALQYERGDTMHLLRRPVLILSGNQEAMPEAQDQQGHRPLGDARGACGPHAEGGLMRARVVWDY